MRRITCAILGALGGCLGSPQFPCQTDEECNLVVGGVCADAGYCAYPNDGCPSKFSYHAHAPGELAGTCVPIGETDTAGTTDTGCMGDACLLPACGAPLTIDFYAAPGTPKSDLALDALFAAHFVGDALVAVGRQREGVMDGTNLDLAARRWPRAGGAIDASFAAHQTDIDTALAVAGDGTRVLVGGVTGVDSSSGNQQPSRLDGGRPYLLQFPDSGLESPLEWMGANAEVGKTSAIYDLAVVDGRAFGVGTLNDTLWAFTFDLSTFPTQDSDVTSADLGGLTGRLWAITPVPGTQEFLVAGQAGMNAWIGRLAFAGAELTMVASYGDFLNDEMVGDRAQDIAISRDGARAAVVGLTTNSDEDVWVQVFDPKSRTSLWTDVIGVAVDPEATAMNLNDEAHAATFTPAGDLLVAGEFGADGAAASDAFVVRYPAAEFTDVGMREANTCLLDLADSTHAHDLVLDEIAGEVVVVGDNGTEFWAHRLPLSG